MAGSYSSLRAEKLTPSKKQAEHALPSDAEAQKSAPTTSERMWGLTLY